MATVNRNVKCNGVFYPKWSTIKKSDDNYDLFVEKGFIEGEEPQEVNPIDSLTKDEIVGRLEKLWVQFNKNDKKADLKDLLQSALDWEVETGEEEGDEE